MTAKKCGKYADMNSLLVFYIMTYILSIPMKLVPFFDDIYIQSSLKPAVFLAFCRRARDMNCFRERERTC